MFFLNKKIDSKEGLVSGGGEAGVGEDGVRKSFEFFLKNKFKQIGVGFGKE